MKARWVEDDRRGRGLFFLNIRVSCIVLGLYVTYMYVRICSKIFKTFKGYLIYSCSNTANQFLHRGPQGRSFFLFLGLCPSILWVAVGQILPTLQGLYPAKSTFSHYLHLTRTFLDFLSKKFMSNGVISVHSLLILSNDSFLFVKVRKMTYKIISLCLNIFITYTCIRLCI